MSSQSPKPAKRIQPVLNNVWEWVADASSKSPVQPVSNLGQGFIEYNPPQYLIDAHKNALNNVESNQYGPTFGRPRFKQALAKAYSPLYGRELSTESEICICTGATEGILSSLMAFIEPGDEVIVVEPVFNLYLFLIQFVGGVVKTIPLKPPSESLLEMKADEWVLDPGDLQRAVTPRTKMMIMNSPHNPLGKVFTKQELLKIGEICAKNSLVILSDEVYERISYTPSFPRIATLSAILADHTITIGSVGKSFNATGWRVGFLIGKEHLIRPLQWAHVLLCYVSPGPAQEAAAIGFEDAEKTNFWESNKTMIRNKVDDFCEYLHDLGLPYVKPSGAYFIFVDTRNICIPDEYEFPPEMAMKSWDYKVCWFLICEFGVATIPGNGFYFHNSHNLGDNWLRLTVCKSDEDLQLAKSRLNGLKKYLARRR